MITISHIRRILPSLRDYRDVPKTWQKDLLAGITVGIVALPLALAFGVSSGAGAEAGLITAIIAGLVAAVFGGSNIQVSGPTGAMVVVLLPIVAAHGAGALAVVSLMAGALVVLAGIFKLGRAIAYIPWPVIEGFTLGIAVIIFFQQVPAALGVTAGPSTNAVWSAVQSAEHVDWATVWQPLALVAIVVLTMVIAPKIHPAIPGSMVGIVIATLVALLPVFSVTSIGTLPDQLPAPHLPAMDWALIQALFMPALAVAALAAIESLLSARVAASISDTGPYDADRELFGQGLASVAAGFFGGIPATGAIARTAVNIRAGGKTRLSAIVHALVLLLVVYAASTVVSTIPLAALAGVLMVTSFRMVSLSTVSTILHSTRSDALVFTITALITVSFDLIVAVGIGVFVAGFFAIRSLVKSSGVQREILPEPAREGDDQIALIRVNGALFFGTAEGVLSFVQETKNISVVILSMSQLQILDATGAQVITEIIRLLERKGITVLVKGIKPRHTKLATQVGVVRALSVNEHLFDTLEDAVAHARAHVKGLTHERS